MQLWISRSHGYLEVWLKSLKVRDTDISLNNEYINHRKYHNKQIHKMIFRLILKIRYKKYNQTIYLYFEIGVYINYLINQYRNAEVR